jgi:hypothetical protein
MKICLAIIAVFLFAFGNAHAQSVDCPAGKACVDQADFNRMVGRLEELLAAKDLINKLLTERGASDATINSALKTIEGWKELDAVNGLIIVKYEQVIALYEKVLAMYERVVDNLEKRLNKPKSALSKFLTTLKEIALVLAGVTLGRGL